MKKLFLIQAMLYGVLVAACTYGMSYVTAFGVLLHDPGQVPGLSTAPGLRSALLMLQQHMYAAGAVVIAMLLLLGTVMLFQLYGLYFRREALRGARAGSPTEDSQL